MVMAGQRVVVTGGAGFIGVHSVEALLAAGAEVLVIDDLRHASYRPLPGAARLEAADVAEPAARDAITSWRPSAILHLAAQGCGVDRRRMPARRRRFVRRSPLRCLVPPADARGRAGATAIPLRHSEAQHRALPRSFHESRLP